MVSDEIHGSILEVRGEGAYGTGEITAVPIAPKNDPRRDDAGLSPDRHSRERKQPVDRRRAGGLT
jgi:hypothetical protein